MKRFLPIIVLVSFLMGPAAFAQEAEKEPAMEETPKEEKAEVDMADYYLDATTIEDKYSGKYSKITPQSLSKLYWRLHVFDSGDNRAIDNYMLINECQIYQDNVNNDFEWNVIREAVKKVVNDGKKNFPTQFEFFVPVHLGRYDTEQKGFYLVDYTGYEQVRRLEVRSITGMHEVCGKDGEIKDYPKAVLFVLQEALTYVFAEVDEHVAQAYILRKQREILDLPPDERQRRYERTAYVRMRLNVLEYQGNIRGRSNILAILQSELDGVDLFEDVKGERLLSSMIMKREEGEKRPAQESNFNE